MGEKLTIGRIVHHRRMGQNLRPGPCYPAIITCVVGGEVCALVVFGGYGGKAARVIGDATRGVGGRGIAHGRGTGWHWPSECVQVEVCGECGRPKETS